MAPSVLCDLAQHLAESIVTEDENIIEPLQDLLFHPESDTLTALMRKRAVYSPAARAYFARMTTQPSAARKKQLDDWFKAIAPWLNNIELGYICAAHDAQAARLNIMGDTGNLQAFNSPAFTVDRGYKGDGNAAYLDSGIAHNALTKVAQNNMFWYFVNTDPTVPFSAANYYFGTTLTGTPLTLGRIDVNVSPANSMVFRNNAVVSTNIYQNDGALNRYGTARRIAGGYGYYRNGAVGGFSNTASEARQGASVVLLRTGSNFSVPRVGMFLLGAAPNTDTEMNDMMAAIDAATKTYLLAIGAPTA
jgi:hypothetical protein